MEGHIINIKELKAVNCSCKHCVGMCQSSPCIMLPEELEKIMQSEFKDSFMISMWFDEEKNAIRPFVAPKGNPYKMKIGEDETVMHQCSLLTTCGKCKLHEQGLKPFEGRVANHNQTTADSVILRRQVCEQWETKEAIELIEKYFGHQARQEFSAIIYYNRLSRKLNEITESVF